MKIVLFVHSIVSDWNNGHAHFLRGLVAALMQRGHSVTCCEPLNNWSTKNLFATAQAAPIVEFARRFPQIDVRFYDPKESPIDQTEELTAGAHVVIVHEFNEPEIVGAVGFVRRRRQDFLLLFHDTHHRLASLPHQIVRFNLADYDGVLAFGASLAEKYREFGFRNVFIFHEAADTSTFFPREAEKEHDVVWIGNWGDEERAQQIRDYLIGAAAGLPALRFTVHGVRYPTRILKSFDRTGIRYAGWVPNFAVPEVFAKSRVTLHILRSFYCTALPGIPTIRPFEAMACGIPLITTQWRDTEHLFRAGRDYLMAATPAQMRKHIQLLTRSKRKRQDLAGHALETIRRRHHCDLRAEQLEDICQTLTRTVR
ncbi:MAG: glycosyltransferase [Planctomycetes bacterium]|nr:glycosyltransferase [Planctomycetota bacterium]